MKTIKKVLREREGERGITIELLYVPTHLHIPLYLEVLCRCIEVGTGGLAHPIITQLFESSLCNPVD